MNIHVNTTRNDELSRGINCPCAPRDDQMVAHQSDHSILPRKYFSGQPKIVDIMARCSVQENRESSLLMREGQRIGLQNIADLRLQIDDGSCCYARDEQWSETQDVAMW